MSTTKSAIAKSRSRWIEWAFLALMGLLAVAYVVGCDLELRRSKLRAPNASFDAVLAHIPTPQRFGTLERDGTTYVVVIGRLTRIYLASGPPVYVFDRSGRLVDWTYDIGDDPRFSEQWGNPWPSEPISRQQAEAFFTNDP